MPQSHDPHDPANAHPLAEAAQPTAAPHEPEAPAPLIHPLAEAATGTGAGAGASPEATAPPPTDAPLVTIQVQVQPATAALLRAAAAREGADLAAMAALWLDEKAAEAQAHKPPGGSPAK